ncbi:MAG: glycosyltransferase [Saprospirales bacterium]|nr:glycosyltransferase [Saprospirales bacterium]
MMNKHRHLHPPSGPQEGSPPAGPAPLVSVCMLAYNVAPYVGAAIEGVLGQEAPFPIELVIGKDKSTDDTLAICSSYARQYPKIIRILRNWKTRASPATHAAR